MNQKKLNILIRVSTTINYGWGHFQRCLSIRKFLYQKVHWFIDPNSKKIKNFLCKKDDVIEEIDDYSHNKCLNFLRKDKDAILIIDVRKINPSNFSNFDERVYIISDELISNPYRGCKLINMQPISKSNDLFLSGPRYLTFSTKNKEQKSKNFNQGSYPYNFLVSFGARDSRNYTELLLNLILNDTELKKKLNIICLIGDGFKNKKKIIQKFSNIASITLLENYQSLLDLKANCNFAIGAPGISHAERLYMGIATVLLPQNKIHKQIIEGWEDLGCAIGSSLNKLVIISSIHKLISNDFELAKNISKKGQRIVDGLGAKRISQEILKFHGICK